MSHSRPTRAAVLRSTWLAITASAVLVVAALALLLACSPVVLGHAAGLGPGEHRGALGVADGVVPDGVTIHDDALPAVAKLDPSLLRALRRASADAGIAFYVNSGWRSRAYQEQLFQKAVAEHGSEEQAARWVARPGTSIHEAGGAIDLGGADVRQWLSEHGAAYGLCQIYGDEPWHYELRPDARDHGCPPMYADPTHDPRLQQ